MSEKGSVFQKGGGGTNFEQSVQAAFVTTLIISGHAPCLPANEVKEVSFQNTSKGYETDDLLVIAESALGRHRLLMQVKHDVSFTEGNETFKEVLSAFWRDFNNPSLFDKTRDKLIVVKNGLTKEERNHLKTLFNWANSHSNEVNFLTEVNRIKGKKDRLDVYRTLLCEANNGVALSDKELWEFLRCSDVLEYDFLNEGSIDEAYFLNLIMLAKRVDAPTTPKEIWTDVLALASRLNKDGGDVTAITIREQELFKNFAAENLIPHFKAVRKLESDSAAILNPIKNKVGSLHLERTETRNKIVDAVNSVSLVIVTGRPGVGKSAVIKDVLNQEFQTASTFVFRADQLDQPHLAHVFSEQGVHEAIQDILSCIALVPNKIIFIDSLEKLLEADADGAFKQLIALLKQYPDVKIIASSRKHVIDLIIRKFDLETDRMEFVEVAPLNDEELLMASDAFPQLVPVLQNEKIKTLLRSHKYLDFAITVLNKSSAADYANVSLEEFKGKLWDALVVDEANTKNGWPIKREQAFMEIAVKRAREMKLFTEPLEADAEAIQLLQNDEIVFQEEGKRRYAPSHDILEDWALIRYVASKHEDYPKPKDLFENLGNEPAIRRGFRLWVEDSLLRGDEKVSELIRSTIADASIEKYWADESLAAVFKAEDCNSFFAAFAEELTRQEGRFLNRCLHIITTACKESSSEHNNLSLPLPIGSGWKEAVLFINQNLSKLEKLRPSIVDFLSEWQLRLQFQEDVTDDESMAAKVIVLHYIQQVEAADEVWQTEFMQAKSKELIGILYDLAAVAKTEIAELVGRAFAYENNRSAWRLNSFYEAVLKKCVGGLGNNTLIRECSDLVIQTAWEAWKLKPKPEPEPSSILAFIGNSRLRHEECWGIQDKHEFFPSGIYKTPLHYLLNLHPVKGLLFVTEFLNYATEFYVNADCEYKRELDQVEIKLNDGSIVKQWASAELWMAYRGLSATHYAIESLLMSLEKFLLDTARSQTDISRTNLNYIFDYLLRNSNNVATAGVLSSVAMAYPEEVGEAFLPLLTVRDFYSYDMYRAMQESSALAPMDNKISFAQKERWESNQLPHRKKYMLGLREFVLNYQFNTRTLNERIHAIFDELKAALQTADVVWKKLLTEMDIRNHRVGPYDEKLGGFPIQPEYEADVVTLMETGREEAEAQSAALGFSGRLWRAHDGEETIDYATWLSGYESYSSRESHDSFNDRPVTLAVLGLRDFLSKLSTEQKAWCTATLTRTISIILRDTFSRNYHLSSEYNLMEKRIALSSFHLVFQNITEQGERDNLIGLTLCALIAPFGDYEAGEISKYVQTTLFEQCPLEGKRVWRGLIGYAQFKKANPSFYDDHDAERLKAARQREEEFIESATLPNVPEPNFLGINLSTHDGHYLIRALTITPYLLNEAEYTTFIKTVLPLLIEDLGREEDYPYSRNSGRQVQFREVSDAKFYFAELLLNATPDFSKQVLDLILDSAYKVEIEKRRQRSDVFDFARDTLEYTIGKLDEAIANKTETVANTAISNFWSVWQHLYLKIQSSGKQYFAKQLLLDIDWKKDATHWRPLEGRKEFYKKAVLELGKGSSQSVLNVLSTIGEKALLPDGLNWLVTLLKANPIEAATLASVAGERLVKRLYHNHMSAIKRDKQLMQDYIWILDQMVDLGLSEAYLFRENAISYKQS